MSRPSTRSLSRSRAVVATGILGLAAVAMAARQPATPPATQTATQAAAPAPVVAPAAADSQKTKADSVAAPMDSAAMAGMSGMAGMNHMQMAAAPAPQTHAAPGTWPVDPVTGQTLINGVPVVGKVFIMQKTDGTVKIANVAAARHGEPPAPAAAVVKSAYTPAKSVNTRRMRGIMIQATLWDMDHKKLAARQRFYGPQH